ncbi:hypothetical protein DV736_g4226, partial [Chaetothyriales sp. CBS 134916]
MRGFPPATVSADPAPPHSVSDSPRKHAACDECRKRKLKCSRQTSGCTRCVKNGLFCVYSEQKQMGRPKKRQKIDHDGADDVAGDSAASNTAIDPRLSAADQERVDFENICNSPIAQMVRRSGLSSSNTPPSDNARTAPDADWYNIQYPADLSSWPDFSHTALPTPVACALEKENTTPNDMGGRGHGAPDCGFYPNAINTLTSVPDCACLPNLYLTLSTLSALSAFPPSCHTVSTLANAHRTARDVIYCAVCPKRFQTCSQNVMLSATLLTVLIDQWKHMSKSPAIDIRTGFCTSPAPPHGHPEMTARQDLEWRTFAYHLMRYFVFGDQPLPLLPDQPSEKALSYLPSSSAQQHITLIFLADAMERRQRVWHDTEPDTGEFPRTTAGETFSAYSGFTLEDLKELDKCRGQDNGLLCIELVKHAKRWMRSLDREPPTLA